MIGFLLAIVSDSVLAYRMSEEVFAMEDERISYGMGAIIGGICGIVIAVLNYFLMFGMTGHSDFQSAPIWIGFLLAIVGASVGCFVVRILNSQYSSNIQSKNKMISEIKKTLDLDHGYTGSKYEKNLLSYFNYYAKLKRNDFFLDLEPVFYGAIIGALVGFFSCLCSCVAVQGNIESINVLYPASIVTLAVLGAIAGAIVRVYCKNEIKEMNDEIQENYIKELTAEKERAAIELVEKQRRAAIELEEKQRRAAIELEEKQRAIKLKEEQRRAAIKAEEKRKQIEAKLAESTSKLQQIHNKSILSDNDLSDIASAFELRKNIPKEREKLRKALQADKEKIYSKTLSALGDRKLKERLSLAITGFKILQMIEPGNQEYKTAIERLTDPSKLVTKENGFDLTSKYAQPLRDLAASSRSKKEKKT
jgi:flagellar motor component MotA